MAKKIGLFGGTFDPIHLGHAILAERVLTDFCLDELIFIPAKLPPHKHNINTTAHQRYEMTALTASALGEKFSVSDYELNADGISYSYNTVAHWRQNCPDCSLYFIAGTDIFITIESWQNWEELFNLCNFIVVKRNGATFTKIQNTIPPLLHHRITTPDKHIEKSAGDIIFYSMSPVNISSTKIRAKMDEDRCSEMLQESVYQYIIDHNLYLSKSTEKK